jgi:hypothetical protein
MEVWLDDRCVLDLAHVDSWMVVKFAVNEAPAQHRVKFTMKNKQAHHTVLDSAGSIVEDACLLLSDFSIDHIKIDRIFLAQARYQHDFNGTQPPAEHEFFGTLGCNGTVSLTFDTPVYPWILKNT